MTNVPRALARARTVGDLIPLAQELLNVSIGIDDAHFPASLLDAQRAVTQELREYKKLSANLPLAINNDPLRQAATRLYVEIEGEAGVQARLKTISLFDELADSANERIAAGADLLNPALKWVIAAIVGIAVILIASRTR